MNTLATTTKIRVESVLKVMAIRFLQLPRVLVIAEYTRDIGYMKLARYHQIRSPQTQRV